MTFTFDGMFAGITHLGLGRKGNASLGVLYTPHAHVCTCVDVVYGKGWVACNCVVTACRGDVQAERGGQEERRGGEGGGGLCYRYLFGAAWRLLRCKWSASVLRGEATRSWEVKLDLC